MELRYFDVLLYPPGICLILLLAAIISWRLRKLSLALTSLAFLILVVFSMPITSSSLMQGLEQHPPIPPDKLALHNAGAIVVLGGGIHPYAAEYDSPTLTYAVLERIRYAAFIHRHTGLPILVSEGLWSDNKASGAQVMSRTLMEDYAIKNIILENKAMSTWQNAEYSKVILEKMDVNTIFLVTNSWHMTRAVYIFNQQGFNVIPAPTLSRPDTPVMARHFIPDGKSMERSQMALHEYLGMAWYRLRSLIDA